MLTSSEHVRNSNSRTFENKDDTFLLINRDESAACVIFLYRPAKKQNIYV